MTEQPPSAEAQALADALAERIYTWPGHAFTDGCVAYAIDALIVQGVAAERERWQNRDRQRLEQIERLQETVESVQSARDERPAPIGEQSDFARCLRCVSHELTRDVCGYAGRCVRQATATPPSPAAVGDYTERARELLRALHCWRLLYHDARPIDDPDVGQIADTLSAVASERDAAAIRALGGQADAEETLK